MSDRKEAKCASCNGVISGPVLTALNKTWHPQHFTCWHCKKPINTDEKFRQHDGFNYCEACTVKVLCKKCHACKLPITGKVLQALNETWHEGCFVCTVCRKSLYGTTFLEKDGNPFCETDFHENFSDRCRECNRPITDQAIIALDAKWHVDCFQCLKCKSPVAAAQFRVENGYPVCAKCK